ncbi:MAG: DegT/DnrJ/EryC1/StrS family aminotransferase [Xanthomonadales bacterium]|nr:DegT/DnrJ/EryC1/StrS family aminotransferase [Xanthomonadales bacterium]
MPLKTIRSKADLAINGAPPTFDEPLHVGRPNIGNREAFLQRVNQILDSQWLTNNGPMVQEFEQRIAEHLGVKHCIAMCNGTIALEIAIRALGLEGEVVSPQGAGNYTLRDSMMSDLTENSRGRQTISNQAASWLPSHCR